MSDSRSDQPVPPAVARAADAPETPVEYPQNRVVAIADEEPTAAEVVHALTQRGFLESEVSVATGPGHADALQQSTGRSKLGGLAIRLASKLGAANMEMELKNRYEAALRDGHYVVTVDAPTDERKERAVEILRAGGAHDVNYFGKFTIETLVPPNR